MSVSYIGPKSRTERPRKTTIGTKVAHVTSDSDTIFKVGRSRSQGRGHIVAAFRLQLVVSLFCAWNITTVEINSGVYLLKDNTVELHLLIVTQQMQHYV